MLPETSSFFLSAEKVEALAAWKSSEPNVASLHLPVDASGAYPAILDRLIRDATAADPALARSSRDVEKIAAFVRRSFVPGSRRGLCVYSCVKYGIFETFAVPETLTPSLTVSHRPYLRPLNDLRGRSYRFLSVQGDAASARFTEIHLGEHLPLESVSGDFNGPDLTRLAARVNGLYRDRRADRLVLGAEPALLAALEPLLDAEPLNRLIHESLLGPERPVETVVERVRHNELEALKLREDVLLSHYLRELAAGGAVSGLERVAEALQQGCVRRLLVREGWAKMGRCCPACGRLSVNHRSCPWCFRATEAILNLVEELSDRAAAAGVEVFRVSSESRLDGIGVVLAARRRPASVRAGRVPGTEAR
ncbi:MAG: hypothetical protein KGL74_14720 [Elusimicrobia bacterium]|nr:hypothetical protein [Elusimicrobiota bacterium]